MLSATIWNVLMFFFFGLYFFSVYSILQPLCCSDLRTDLPSDARTCCFLLVHRCIDSLPFTTGNLVVIYRFICV